MSMVAIATLAGVGVNLYIANKSANVSKEAAAIQGKGAEAAQAFNERVYADQQRTLAPFVAAGGPALDRMNARPKENPYAAATFDPRRFTLGQARPTLFRPQTEVRPALTPSVAPLAAPPPDRISMNLGLGRTVRIQAPTGETRDVPFEQAEQYVARGGRRVY